MLLIKKIQTKCRHPESHRGYRRHKPGYCSYTIAADGGSGYRSRFSTLRRLYATMYNNPPQCVHRDSNPNLNLGRVKYYPCTMDARRMQQLGIRLKTPTNQKKEKKKILSTSAGFEPTRAEPTRFRVWRLNHSAMMP